MDPITIALTLAQFAPTVMKFFGVGEKPVAVAERVIDIAQAVTGAKTPEDAIAAMQAQAQFAQQFNLAVLAADTELEKAYLSDRADARHRDIELAKTGHRNSRADIMVLIDAVGLLACLIVLAVYRENMEGEMVALLSTIASIFGLCLRDAHQFEFGSSRGSEQKTDLLARAPAIK